MTIILDREISKGFSVSVTQQEHSKYIRLDFHQSHVGVSLVLNPDELKALRNFLDEAIFLSGNGKRVLARVVEGGKLPPILSGTSELEVYE